MTAEAPYRVWFNPPKFWAATRQMSKEAADSLFDRVYSLAELRDFDSLRRYDFVEIDHVKILPAKIDLY